MTLYIYFFLISISLIGYGLFLSYALSITLTDLGNLGILGLITISFISYLTTLFTSHNYIFNSIILVIGLIIFFFFRKKIENFKFQFLIYLIFLILLFLFISIGKNHDDFPYYHFPYTMLISEFSHPIGIGLLNNGFRSPSSIFFINSMFYLPIIQFHSFHFAAAFIFGFANLTLINLIFNRRFYQRIKLINYLSLIILIFINIFFYRLAEHGTDRSGMILTFLFIIYILIIINYHLLDTNSNLEDYLKLAIIYLCFVITIKPFFFINIIFFYIFLLKRNVRKIFIDLFFSSTFYFCLLLLFFVLFFTFINSSCLIFPLEFTCLENLPWSISSNYINDVKIWFELWSKGGANPHFVIEDKIEFIKNFNWINIWIKEYFFNKVLDYLLGLILLTFVIYLTFYSLNKKTKIIKYNYKVVYFLIIILFIEWFYNHPTLRYGGYHVISLILFIPLCILVSEKSENFKIFIKKSCILIIITCVIFASRNFMRLKNEFQQYNYNPLVNSKYIFVYKDVDHYMRYNNLIKKNIDILNQEIFFKKIIFIPNLNE